MKKAVYLILITILLLILDNTLITFFAINHIYPSLLFVFIISYSIINDPIEGIVLGVLAGLLQDLYFFNGIGINMVSNLITCYLASQIGKGIFKDKSIIPIVSTFFLSFLKGLLLLGILFSLKIKSGGISVILYKALYDMIASIILYRLVFKLSETKTMKKEWRF